MDNVSNLDIRGSIVKPTSSNYEESIARKSETAVLHPAYIIFPETPSDISVAIKFALSQSPPLEIAVKGGGCNSSPVASSEGGLVIDLSHMNAVVVSVDKKSVVIQGGALWGDVYTELDKHGLVGVGGNVWFVGVGGFSLGGGHSFLSGQYGLAIDNLLGATVALADGRIVKCSQDEEPDLFWAIRGGGNQFGVVAELVVKTHPASGPALVGALAYPGTELRKVLEVVREFIRNQPPTSYLILAFSRAPPEFHPSIMILPYLQGSQSSAEAALSPFRTKITPVFDQTGFAPTFNAVSHSSDAFLSDAPPRYLSGGAAFSELWDDVVEHVFGEWMAFTEYEERRSGIVLWEFGFRDKIAEVPKAATAFSVREPSYYAVVTTRYSRPETDDVSKGFISKVATYISGENAKRTGKRLGTPLNIALSPDLISVEEVFGENAQRLREVKEKYDPNKVWRKGWFIDPEGN